MRIEIEGAGESICAVAWHCAYTAEMSTESRRHLRSPTCRAELARRVLYDEEKTLERGWSSMMWGLMAGCCGVKGEWWVGAVIESVKGG